MSNNNFPKPEYHQYSRFYVIGRDAKGRVKYYRYEGFSGDEGWAVVETSLKEIENMIPKIKVVAKEKGISGLEIIEQIVSKKVEPCVLKKID